MGEFKTISDLLKIDAEHWQARDEEIKAWEKAQDLRAKKERYQRQVPERYWSESIDTYKTDTEERRTHIQCRLLGAFSLCRPCLKKRASETSRILQPV